MSCNAETAIIPSSDRPCIQNRRQATCHRTPSGCTTMVKTLLTRRKATIVQPFARFAVQRQLKRITRPENCHHCAAFRTFHCTVAYFDKTRRQCEHKWFRRDPKSIRTISHIRIFSFTYHIHFSIIPVLEIVIAFFFPTSRPFRSRFRPPLVCRPQRPVWLSHPTGILCPYRGYIPASGIRLPKAPFLLRHISIMSALKTVRQNNASHKKQRLSVF